MKHEKNRIKITEENVDHILDDTINRLNYQIKKIQELEKRIEYSMKNIKENANNRNIR
jgi:hypothetical protein